MKTLPKLVHIEQRGDTWFVLYSETPKFARRSAAQFSAKDHSKETVINWVRNNPKLILSSGQDL